MSLKEKYFVHFTFANGLMQKYRISAVVQPYFAYGAVSVI